MLGLKDQSSGDFRNDRDASSQPCSARDTSWESASRLNWTLDGALLQLFHVVLNLYWCWKTKAHLSTIKTAVGRKSVLRVTDCERTDRLLGLGVFEDENTVD